MAHRNSGIAVLLLHHQLRHWLTNDVATAKHNALLTRSGDAVTLQKGEDTQRRGRDETRQSDGHTPHVDGMETVYVFAIIHCLDNFLLVDVLRQGQLHDKSVHVFVLVQLVYASQQFGLGNVFLKADEGRLKATLLASNHFVLHICFRTTIMAH